MSSSSALHGDQPAKSNSPPQTPQQQLRSSHNSFGTTSPGSSFRNEDDAIIFEIGTRWLRAGFEGSSAPVCVVGFDPEESRRVGDYRGLIEGDSGLGPLADPVDAEEWSRGYELWGLDMRQIDLGLVEDKIERIFRDTYNQYLLTDAGPSRLVLTLPSLMPHPLLSALLSTLFSRWRFPSITLLPSATMSATAAGLRSALVVDIGWAETTATCVYEYREIVTKRSTRAMKTALQEMGRLLTGLASGNDPEKMNNEISVGFKYCEEIMTRLAWCNPRAEPENKDEETRTFSIPSPNNPNQAFIDVPASLLAEPVERGLLASNIPEIEMDDEEKSIPILLYNALMALPPDARGTCMSRIVFVGGGARIPGLRPRILHEISLLIDRYGWSPIRGKAVDRLKQRLEELKILSQSSGEKAPSGTIAERPEPSQEELELDFVEQKLRRQNKEARAPVQGVLREIESLGPWAGASLVTSLKIRGMVEIEREKFLQQGLAGGSRDSEYVVPDRRSGLRAGDRSSWTLAGWA